MNNQITKYDISPSFHSVISFERSKSFQPDSLAACPASSWSVREVLAALCTDFPNFKKTGQAGQLQITTNSHPQHEHSTWLTQQHPPEVLPQHEVDLVPVAAIVAVVAVVADEVGTQEA